MGVIHGEIIGADFGQEDHIVIYVKAPSNTSVGHLDVVVMGTDEYKTLMLSAVQESDG